MSHATHDETGFRRIAFRMERTIFTGKIRPHIYPWYPVAGEKCPSCHGYGHDDGGPGSWRCIDCNGTGIWPAHHYIPEGGFNVYIEIEKMLGRTIKEVSVDEDRYEVRFVMEDGANIVMYHEQDCCEGVHLDDVIGGELTDLIGSPLVVAEVVTNSESHPDGKKPEYEDDSFTWTFYKLGTAKSGVITLRWYGSSNGYYSESVSLRESK